MSLLVFMIFYCGNKIYGDLSQLYIIKILSWTRVKINTIIIFMRYALLIFLTGLVTLFTDCAGPYSAGRPLPEIRPQDLIRKIQAHGSHLNTLQGNARLSVNSELGNFSGTFHVKAHLPDSLYAKVEGPFGVDVALMRVHANDLLFYSPFLHLAYTGSLHDSIRGVLPFQMDMGDFLFNALGLLMIPADRLDDVSLLYSIDGHYVVNLKNGERIWIHPKGPVITRWEKTDEQGNLIWTWEGKQFKRTGGVRLPQTIQITVEEPRQRLTVYYTQRHTNRNLKPGWSRFKLPEGVKTIAL